MVEVFELLKKGEGRAIYIIVGLVKTTMQLYQDCQAITNTGDLLINY